MRSKFVVTSSLIGTRLATLIFYLPDRPLSLSAHQGVAYANEGIDE